MPSMPSFCAGTQARGVEEPTLGRRCHRALRSGEKLPRNDRFCESSFSRLGSDRNSLSFGFYLLRDSLGNASCPEFDSGPH